MPRFLFGLLCFREFGRINVRRLLCLGLSVSFRHVPRDADLFEATEASAFSPSCLFSITFEKNKVWLT
jgi:hypothetical protein